MAKGQDIVSVIKQQIEQFGAPLSMIDVGNVIEVGDGIARGLGLGAVLLPESAALFELIKRAAK